VHKLFLHSTQPSTRSKYRNPSIEALGKHTPFVDAAGAGLDAEVVPDRGCLGMIVAVARILDTQVLAFP